MFKQFLFQLFRDPLLHELGLSMDQVERLFPRVDELFELHAAFLRSLLKLQGASPDRSIEEIGPALLQLVSFSLMKWTA